MCRSQVQPATDLSPYWRRHGERPGTAAAGYGRAGVRAWPSEGSPDGDAPPARKDTRRTRAAGSSASLTSSAASPPHGVYSGGWRARSVSLSPRGEELNRSDEWARDDVRPGGSAGRGSQRLFDSPAKTALRRAATAATEAGRSTVHPPVPLLCPPRRKFRGPQPASPGMSPSLLRSANASPGRQHYYMYHGVQLPYPGK